MEGQVLLNQMIFQYFVKGSAQRRGILGNRGAESVRERKKGAVVCVGVHITGVRERGGSYLC